MTRALLMALLLSPLAHAQGGLEPLLDKADANQWRTRWSAVRGLASLPLGDDVFKLRGLLLRDPRARVREAIAWACFMQPQLGSATLLGIALRKDKDPGVRRAAARALVHFKDRRAVAALVEALGKEEDRRTLLQIVETLRSLTPAPCLLDAQAWTAWWNRHGADPQFRPADDAARKGTYEGIELETRTVAAVRPDKEGDKRRKPPHLLFLPGFGWSTEVYGPYLLPLRRHAAITWVKLPTVQRLTGRSGYGDDIPVYPVARLVRALDSFRESLELDRFVVVAPGASGWIAMRYAQTFPNRCAGLILLDTALDKKAYVDVLQYAAARGDKGERFTAKTLMHQNSAPLNEATLSRMHAYGLERGFHDIADLEIGYLYARAREPQGFASVPEIRWSKRARIETPTLFLYSGASAFSGHRHATRIGRHFPRSMVAPIREVRGMPYVEMNETFHAVLNDFLRRYGLID